MLHKGQEGREVKLKNYFSIGEAAKAVHTTTETLRHYDRIGLVTPSKKDPWTNYRYYTQQDLVRLHTVRALQLMDLPLRKIKEVLEYDDLEQIVAFLSHAEKKADEKIASLQYSKSKIQAARADYEKKSRKGANPEGVFVRELAERVILLSDTLETPTLDTLWNYLRHFYGQIGASQKEKFSFEDTAGIYTAQDFTRLFAICNRHGAAQGLRKLPEGTYLCVNCAEENREQAMRDLVALARSQYVVEPAFTLQLIVVSGILHWNYELQVYVGE